MPEVQGIQVVAHSRGTDVTTSALRELIIEVRGSNRDPRKVLKVKTLILAAPDLDFGVVGQRLIAERFGPAIGQINVYVSENDGALSISQTLMDGVRFGRLQPSELTETERQIFSQVRNVHFISASNPKGAFGHAYYRDDPDVMSDIAVVLQTGAKPGSGAATAFAPGRELLEYPGRLPSFEEGKAGLHWKFVRRPAFCTCAAFRIGMNLECP